MNHLCSMFVDDYHRCRPHQSKDNGVLVKLGRRKTQQQLGGLLKHYYRNSA